LNLERAAERNVAVESKDREGKEPAFFGSALMILQVYPRQGRPGVHSIQRSLANYNDQQPSWAAESPIRNNMGGKGVPQSAGRPVPVHAEKGMHVPKFVA
jgi:hypothetical protein